MGCAVQSTSYRIEACTLRWERQEEACITAVADVMDSLNEKYFFISTPSESCYVWFDTGMGVDPAIMGLTGIQVSISSGATAAQVATALRTALNGTGDFEATNDGAVVCYTTLAYGAPESALSDSGVMTATGFTFEVCIEGVGSDLGDTEGGVEITIEQVSTDIISDQGGQVPVDIIKQATNATVACSLLEMSTSRWDLLVAKALGDSFTPSMGTKLIGFGESKNFRSLYAIAGKLILHPLSRATSDLSEDIVLWKSIPLPESFNFSGEETSKLAISFRGLVDKKINPAINIFSRGDHTQNGLRI